MHKWRKYIFLSDIFTLYLALVLAVIFRGLVHFKVNQTEAEWISAHMLIFLPSLLFSLLALYIAGLYDPKIIYDRVKTLALLLYTQFATAAFSIISFYVLRTELTPKLTIFFYVIFSILLLSLTRSYVFSSIQKLSKAKAIFFGKNRSLLEKINTNYAPFTFTFLESREEVLSAITPKTNYIVYEENILDIENSLFIEELKKRGLALFSYNQYYEFLYKKIDFDNLFQEDLVRNIAESKETIAHYLFRRFIDIFVGIVILPVYLLSLPFVWLGIYIQDRGDIISFQERISYLGRRVRIYKIRTMTGTDLGGVVADNEDKNVKSVSGLVVTPFGKFLRKTRIDELPQCINLLRGDISLIGPRADIVGVYENMKAEIANYRLRLLVPQGLTGWAQVHQTTPPRTKDEYKERLSYELFYVRNKSILLDVSIILKTIKTLLSRTGQ